jgi:hypothetical protein
VGFEGLRVLAQPRPAERGRIPDCARVRAPRERSSRSATTSERRRRRRFYFPAETNRTACACIDFFGVATGSINAFHRDSRPPN